MIKRSGVRCCDSSMIARCNPCPCPKIMTWRTTRFQILVFTCRPEEYEPAETEEETAFASIDLAKCLQRSS